VIEGEDNERLQFTSQNLQFWLSLFAQNWLELNAVTFYSLCLVVYN
jgi:hypothetical protein